MNGLKQTTGCSRSLEAPATISNLLSMCERDVCLWIYTTLPPHPTLAHPNKGLCLLTVLFAVTQPVTDRREAEEGWLLLP